MRRRGRKEMGWIGSDWQEEASGAEGCGARNRCTFSDATRMRALVSSCSFRLRSPFHLLLSSRLHSSPLHFSLPAPPPLRSALSVFEAPLVNEAKSSIGHAAADSALFRQKRLVSAVRIQPHSSRQLRVHRRPPVSRHMGQNRESAFGADIVCRTSARCRSRTVCILCHRRRALAVWPAAGNL